MKLVRYPDVLLTQVSKEVEQADLEAVMQVVAPMTEIMNDFNGVGLSAVQAGMLKRFAILNMKADPYYDPSTPATIILINPVVTDKQNPVRLSEGCLSLPLYSEMQDRFADITITYRDENWNEVTREFSGLMAQCILHEVDHMDGHLIIEKDSVMKVQMYRKKLKKRGAL